MSKAIELSVLAESPGAERPGARQDVIRLATSDGVARRVSVEE
ncbi:MAG: hypothetical protein U5K70_01825 [Halodesulfurarchaeum sp.]|nr:hypothetical protein [Halodesulfurarchaeum sp.]